MASSRYRHNLSATGMNSAFRADQRSDVIIMTLTGGCVSRTYRALNFVLLLQKPVSSGLLRRAIFQRIIKFFFAPKRYAPRSKSLLYGRICNEICGSYKYDFRDGKTARCGAPHSVPQQRYEWLVTRDAID